MSDEPSGPEPPDPTTPDGTALHSADLRPEFAPVPPFPAMPEPPPNDPGWGCLLQLLPVILILVVAGWVTLDDVGSGLFNPPHDAAASTTSSTAGSSSTSTSSTTTTTLASVEEYTVLLSYAGTCEGDANFFLRVRDGATIELHVGSPGAEGVLLSTSTVSAPGRSFSFGGIPGVSIAFDGQIDGDTVSGTGTWSDFGPGCNFTFSGSRV